METKAIRRGRPPKGADLVKAEYLDIRLGAAEKATFRDAAELAGLDLSAWVRERLRIAARKELEAAGMPVSFLDKARSEYLLEARYVPRSRVFLRFADGLEGTWSFKQLELEMGGTRVATVRAIGTSMEVQNKWNDKVEIDSSSLRAAVDPQYAADLERAFLKRRGPLETNARSLPRK